MKVSLVISVFNEEDVLHLFWKELSEVISQIQNVSFEVVFVNDGSSDSSQSILQDIQKNASVETQVIEFSRNFGHEAAMIAGIDYSSGDAVICMDADLQHPPSVLPDLIA
ncbi:MAG: glycosyltransferase, partial [Flavobacteriales bacterium]|nr:glycosyltransferase [Flavobacteriales bacterium]